MINDTTEFRTRIWGPRAASAAAGTLGLFLLFTPCPAQVAADRSGSAQGFGQGPGIRATTAAVSSTNTAENAATAIRPFSFRATDEDLAELRRRIVATRWPEKETVADHSQGVPLAAMRAVAGTDTRHSGRAPPCARRPAAP